MWKKLLKQFSLPESYISITLGFLVVIVAGLLIYNNFNKSKQTTSSTNEAKPSDQQEEVAVLPTNHTVVSGENLWQIAEKYYGSGYNWVTLATENKITNPNVIVVGQVIAVPKADVIKPAEEQILATATQPAKNYTVVRGDNLWNIAVKEYGDGFAWTKISNANKLVQPNLIHAGNILTIPQ